MRCNLKRQSVRSKLPIALKSLTLVFVLNFPSALTAQVLAVEKNLLQNKWQYIYNWDEFQDRVQSYSARIFANDNTYRPNYSVDFSVSCVRNTPAKFISFLLSSPDSDVRIFQNGGAGTFQIRIDDNPTHEFNLGSPNPPESGIIRENGIAVPLSSDAILEELKSGSMVKVGFNGRVYGQVTLRGSRTPITELQRDCEKI